MYILINNNGDESVSYETFASILTEKDVEKIISLLSDHEIIKGVNIFDYTSLHTIHENELDHIAWLQIEFFMSIVFQVRVVKIEVATFKGKAKSVIEVREAITFHSIKALVSLAVNYFNYVRQHNLKQFSSSKEVNFIISLFNIAGYFSEDCPYTEKQSIISEMIDK